MAKKNQKLRKKLNSNIIWWFNMVFKNEKQLEAFLMKKCKNALIKSQEQVYQIIDRFVKQYYAEFSPEMYERTYQLYRSLVKSDIRQVGKGYEASIYFDLDTLDHHLHRIRVNGNVYSYEGKHKWSEQQILDNALTGDLPHGGYAGGTAIWNEALSVLNTEAIEVLKRMLISEGVPLKK